MNKKVVKIVSPKKIEVSKDNSQPLKRKVAAYARVSTDSEEQLKSYAAQIDYYKEYIRHHEDWEFVGIYTDEGISGLKTKNRIGFNKMIDDAMTGKIDLIITKSVSRFTRNTIDSLKIIRKLKDNGVECCFEKEGIRTFDSKGELLLTLMSSLAQEESRNLSENVRWGKNKGMQKGNVSISWSSVLGYEKGKNGLPKIIPEQAATVRLIFDLYMQGMSYANIAKELTARNTVNASGKVTWSNVTVSHILQSELYRGSLLRPKGYTVDFLNRKVKKPTSDMPRYYVEKSHEPIIEPEVFDTVQKEIKYRKEYHSDSVFDNTVICGDCGAIFRQIQRISKVTNEPIKCLKCREKYNKSGNHKCKSSQISEVELKKRFMKVFQSLNKVDIISNCEKIIYENTTINMDKEIKKLETEIFSVADMVIPVDTGNERIVVNLLEWQKRGNWFIRKNTDISERLFCLDEQKLIKDEKTMSAEKLVTWLNTEPQEFSDDLWKDVVAYAVRNSDKSIDFIFRIGITVRG